MKSQNFISFLSKLKLYCQYYSLRCNAAEKKNTVFSIIDTKIRHPGLVDRLKTIVSAYFIAKENGFSFKLLFTEPFSLNVYLEPNMYDWVCSEQDISYNLRHSRILGYYHYQPCPSLNKKVRQYHIYRGGDIIRYYSPHSEKHQTWSELFQELFKPTQLVTQEIEKQNLDKNSYFVVHLRFLNTLEHFENSNCCPLNEDEKSKLISGCIDQILALISINRNRKALVCSDSQIFLDRIRNYKGIVVLDGKLGHISHTGRAEDIVLKTFLDFFMISRACKIYSIIYPKMYTSAFPAYAAWSANKEFIRIRNQ